MLIAAIDLPPWQFTRHHDVVPVATPCQLMARPHGAVASSASSIPVGFSSRCPHRSRIRRACSAWPCALVATACVRGLTPIAWPTAWCRSRCTEQIAQPAQSALRNILAPRRRGYHRRRAEIGGPDARSDGCIAVTRMQDGRLSNYRVVSRIGEGGMGTAHRVEHSLLGRAVAVKVPQPEMCCGTRAWSPLLQRSVRHRADPEPWDRRCVLARLRRVGAAYAVM
jgi:hypothetical protein